MHPSLVREARRRLGLGDPIDAHIAQQNRQAIESADRARTPHSNAALVGVKPSRHGDITATPVQQRHYCPPNVARDCSICSPSTRDRGPVTRAREQRQADNPRIAAQHEARVRDAQAAMGEAVDPWNRAVDADAARLIVEAEVRGQKLAYAEAYQTAARRARYRHSREYANYRGDVEVS
jgi:hypothetical protein